MEHEAIDHNSRTSQENREGQIKVIRKLSDGGRVYPTPRPIGRFPGIGGSHNYYDSGDSGGSGGLHGSGGSGGGSSGLGYGGGSSGGSGSTTGGMLPGIGTTGVGGVGATGGVAGVADSSSLHHHSGSTRHTSPLWMTLLFLLSGLGLYLTRF